ncbi:DUF6162 family protein [Pseudomonadota bacterium]
MISQTVRTDDGGREGKWVALSIFLILTVAAILLPYHQETAKQQSLSTYQVSIKDLAADELAMIAELRLAHEEIRNMHQDSIEFDDTESWADIAELEALWLAPFIQDKSWERKGKHLWLNIERAIYQGVPQLEGGSASVVLNSMQEDPEIWLHLDKKIQPVISGDIRSERVPLQTSVLIEAGWKQVVFADNGVI